MSIVTLDMLNKECTFRTLNPNDTATFTGNIVGVGLTADLAQAYADLVSYNAAVRTVKPEVSSNLDNLTYFIISQTNSEGDLTKRAFAEEWIQDGSFALLNQTVKRTFTIYSSASTTVDYILEVNKAAGFTIVEV